MDVSNKAFNTIAPADYSFWEALNQVVQEEPTDPIDPTTLGFWAADRDHERASRSRRMSA